MKIYNVTDSPIVVDSEGRILGGREFRDIESKSKEVSAAIKSGDLIVIPEPEEETTSSEAATPEATVGPNSNSNTRNKKG